MGKKNQNNTEEGRGRIESKYNPVLLKECISSGLHAKEILLRMNIRHLQTLKQYAAKLAHDEKQYFEIVGLYNKSSTRLSVNKKGELKLVLSNFLPVDFDVFEGMEFSVTVEENRIILQKM